MGFCGWILARDSYYCQNDLADNEFENFRKEFLQDISLRKLKVGETAVGQIFLVLELPSKNRQNNVDVLCDDIENVTKTHSLEGNGDIILIQISFDGNNIENPPNLMTDDTFERINIRLKRNFSSYINIVYTGKHNFKICDTNRNAADTLKSFIISQEKKRSIFRKKIVCLIALMVLTLPCLYALLNLFLEKNNRIMDLNMTALEGQFM